MMEAADNKESRCNETKFRMIKFSTDNRKTATQLVDCVCQVPDLVECCKLLVNAGHLKQVLMGAKWFIEPSLVNPIVRILENNGVQMNGLFKGKWRTINKKDPELKWGEIICSEKYEEYVWQVLMQFDLEYVVSLPTDVRHDESDGSQRRSCCDKKAVSIRQLLEQCGLPSQAQSHDNDDHREPECLDDIFVPWDVQSSVHSDSFE